VFPPSFLQRPLPHSHFALLAISSLLFFFFSSRRRHTRSKRDWSSDVCSSDLASSRALADELLTAAKARDEASKKAGNDFDVELEIGRASCRVRGSALARNGVQTRNRRAEHAQGSRAGR